MKLKVDEKDKIEVVNVIDPSFVELVSPKGKVKKFKNKSSHQLINSCWCKTPLTNNLYKFAKSPKHKLEAYPFFPCVKWIVDSSIGQLIAFNFISQTNIVEVGNSEDHTFSVLDEINEYIISYAKSMDESESSKK